MKLGYLIYLISIGFSITTKDIYEHIDGDILDMNNDDVLLLGMERGDYTRFLMIKSIKDGKIPVISTGGGIFFSGYGESDEFLST